MNARIAALLFGATAALLCCERPCRDTAACADSTPPRAILEGVVPGRQLEGEVLLAAAAEDDVGVTSVDFAVDGAVVASAARAPWTVRWDSLRAENGTHALSAIAWDAAGNRGESQSISVSVLNAVGAGVSVHTALGLPAAALGAAQSVTAFLSVKPQYVISYDGGRRVPNWVSWELSARWLGATPRQNDFRPDDTLPKEIPQAQLSDYAGSGWDRGHLCPSEDRTATLADNRSTFYLTNMVPQSDSANGGPWAQLEAHLRTLALRGQQVSIVAGGIFAGPIQTIGADGVFVPSATFKVALVLDRPGQGIADVTEQNRVIAVMVPNDTSVARSADWRSFRVPPRQVERATGLRLFGDVPHEVREVLLDRMDAAP